MHFSWAVHIQEKIEYKKNIVQVHSTSKYIVQVHSTSKYKLMHFSWAVLLPQRQEILDIQEKIPEIVNI